MAEGAVLWQISQAVFARTVRANYGVSTLRDYDPLNLAHHGRSILREPDGREMVSGCWATVIPKVSSLPSRTRSSLNRMQGTVMRTSEAMETYFCELLPFKSSLDSSLRLRLSRRGGATVVRRQGR